MKLEMMQNKRTVIASTGMHKYAFVKATQLAETLGGCATANEDKHFKAVFKSAKVAEQFVTEWNAQYEQAQANKQTKAEEKPKKVASGKGKRKPTPAKGNGIDFDAFKGTKSEKNKALHAELVSRGLKDSRADEYQAIWKARPWAKA